MINIFSRPGWLFHSYINSKNCIKRYNTHPVNRHRHNYHNHRRRHVKNRSVTFPQNIGSESFSGHRCLSGITTDPLSKENATFYFIKKYTKTQFIYSCEQSCLSYIRVCFLFTVYLKFNATSAVVFYRFEPLQPYWTKRYCL